MATEEVRSAFDQFKPITDRRVLAILDLLTSSRCRSLDLDQLSTSCNLSRSRLQHLFKEHTGTTPGRYLKQIRLVRAKELLEQSFYTVKQVTFLVGFADISHFVRDYKLRFGQTPTESRRRVRAQYPAKSANR